MYRYTQPSSVNHMHSYRFIISFFGYFREMKEVLCWRKLKWERRDGHRYFMYLTPIRLNQWTRPLNVEKSAYFLITSLTMIWHGQKNLVKQIWCFIPLCFKFIPIFLQVDIQGPLVYKQVNAVPASYLYFCV